MDNIKVISQALYTFIFPPNITLLNQLGYLKPQTNSNQPISIYYQSFSCINQYWQQAVSTNFIWIRLACLKPKWMWLIHIRIGRYLTFHLKLPCTIQMKFLLFPPYFCLVNQQFDKFQVPSTCSFSLVYPFYIY